MTDDSRPVVPRDAFSERKQTFSKFLPEDRGERKSRDCVNFKGTGRLENLGRDRETGFVRD